MKKKLLFTQFFFFAFFATSTCASAQSPLHDSLRLYLNFFIEHATDTVLRDAAKQAKTLYLQEKITDPLSTKLLEIDSLLITKTTMHGSRVFAYAEVLVQLLQDIPPHREHSNYALSVSYLGSLYYRNEHYEKALAHYEESSKIFLKIFGRENAHYATSLHGIGDIYNRLGNYETAIDLHRSASLIRKKIFGEEDANYAYSLNKLGQLYDNLGQYSKAIDLFQEAVRIRKKTLGDEHPVYASSLNNLGLSYSRAGQFDKALPIYQSVLAIDKKTIGEDNLDYATSLNNLALLYQTMGWDDKALPLYQQSLKITERVRGKNHPYFVYTLNNIGTVYSSLQMNDSALALYEQGLAIIKNTVGIKHPSYADEIHNIAGIFNAKGQIDKALALYLEALAIYETALGKNHPRQVASLSMVGSIYKKKGAYFEALNRYKECVTIDEKTFGRNHVRYAINLSELSQVYLELKNQKEAVSLLIESNGIILDHLNQTYGTLSEQEKIRFTVSRLSQFYYSPSLLMSDPFNTQLLGQVYKNELILKSMVLNDQHFVLKTIRKYSDSETLALYGKWQLNKMLLGKQLVLPISRRRPDLDSLQEATTLLEQQLSRQAAPFRSLQKMQAITLKDITSNLRKNHAAIEFIRFRFYDKRWTDSVFYAALVLFAEDTAARFVPLFEEKQLEPIFKASISGRRSVVYGSLYQLIWKPLEKYLAGIQTIYYAPAGLLHRIAIGALHPTGSKQVLGDKYQLHHLLTTRSIALPASSSSKLSSVSLWGNIDYNMSAQSHAAPGKTNTLTDSIGTSFNFYTRGDTRGVQNDDWKSLPGTTNEILRISRLFSQVGISATIDSGSLATEEAFKFLSGRSPHILHVATHGFFLPVKETNIEEKDNVNGGGQNFSLQENPMFRSGLVFAGGNRAWKGEGSQEGAEDGILTAYEIAQLDLSSTELLILSACETALGDIQGSEGVLGLQRAFKIAGVRQMMVSLWRVPDKETTELMTHFYKNWLSGLSTRESLRKAQLKMKESYPPFYWAAFIIIE